MSFVVLSSRVQIPSPDPAALPRSKTLAQLLRPDTRLASVVAGPGFGKTQWVAQWAQTLSPPPAWLTLGHREDDPHSLLVYLRAAWLRACPGLDSEALDTLLRQGFAPDRWRSVADALGCLLETHTNCLIIDDVHHLQGEALRLLEYLMQFSPSSLGWVLIGRESPELDFLSSWRGRGWVIDIGAEQLRFDSQELIAHGLDSEQVKATGGWPMAVDAWRRTGEAESDPSRLLTQVWKGLSDDLKDLLTRCSVFEFVRLTQVAPLCPHLNAPDLLQKAAEQGVFLQRYGPEEFRFHPLSRSFLLQQLRVSQKLVHSSHQLAAPVALSQGDYDEALWHLFEIGATEEAASVLAHWGPSLLEQGAFQKLLHYVEQLPAEGRDPGLRLAYAQALASSHRFEGALQEFLQLTQVCENSTRGQALLGAGKVLVDTLQPSGAKALLRQAYPHLNREQKSQVLLLLAENSLNQGASRQAQRYRRLALAQPGHSKDRLEVRLHLRAGNLEQAREALLREADGSGTGHRNEALLLAYLAVLQGDWSSAELLARSSLRQAQASQERFAESVAWMRIGHALQLKPGASAEEIRACYAKARQLTEAMGAPRLQAEALMGEALFCAHHGEWVRSYDAALQALDLTRQAGDAWLSAWLQLTSAIAARLGQHPGWSDLMQSARLQFDQVHDRFGVVLTQLWVDPESARGLAIEGGFAFVLEKPTLFGPRTAAPTPASAAVEPTQEVQQSLRICLLGPIQVWRGGHEVPHKLWKRKKAKELLGILLSLRGGFISKERLWDLLFPESTPQAAARDLRVLLHALFEVLDPERPHNATARSVVRRDDHYALPWGDELGLDLVEFERFVELGQQQTDAEEAAHLYQRALDLVRGDYLQEFPYADWAAASRERWKQQYLDAASRLAAHFSAQQRFEQVTQIAHLMLQRDRCWEEGYQLLMRSHLQQGRLAQAARVYDQCRQALDEDLGVEPSESTEELYAQALS
jgi:ATP/maltotriose-dependent transcriptional regulator MalT/DNA-binding SARP family transcriptional activator